MRKGILSVMIGLAVLGVAGVIVAQTMPGLIPGAEPSSYGDWAVRCVERSGLLPCDIVQTLKDTKSKKPVMQISYSYMPEKDIYGAQVMLPLGFMINAGVLIRLDGKTDVTDYPVTRCEPEGCFVEKLVKPGELDSFRIAKAGVLIVLGKDGKPIAFPFSLKGFGDALASMVERNKRRSAKSP